jgi:hypothetical protein
MTIGSGISNLVAAQLSQAAYDTFEPANLPAGWVDDLDYYFNDGTNSFSVFVNASTRQAVFAFRGTTTLAQLESDAANAGGSEWESIKGAFASALAAVEAALPGYLVMTDGHSLGGGMAQTAALEFGLSGYGQNALPISPDAVQDIENGGSLDATLAAWAAGGHSFSEATVLGDVTQALYSGDLNLNTNPITYGDTSTDLLSNIYLGLEADGATIAANGQAARGAAITALAAASAHGIDNVVDELDPNASDVVTVPVAFVLTDKQDLNSIGGGFDISDSALAISAGFKALAADSANIDSISFTDGGAPTLVVTGPEATNDAALLAKITGSYDLDVVDVTGQSYDAYEQLYVNGLLSETDYFTPAPSGALLQQDYNQAGDYIGEKKISVAAAGKWYTGRQLDFGAAGHLRSEVYTGVKNEFYTSIEYDYNKAGAETGLTEDVTDVPGESYFSGQFHYGVNETLRWQSAELQDGGYQITGAANHLTLVDHGNDVMTGGGARETFVFPAIYGNSEITDFAAHDSGAGHDTIALSKSDFSNFAAVMGSAANSGANVTLLGAHGQVITLDDMNTTTLAGLAADFKFRG